MKSFIMITTFALAWLPPLAAAEDTPSHSEHMLIKVLSEELDYSMMNMVLPDGTRPYFMAYTITDIKGVSIDAELNAVKRNETARRRALDVDVRVGDYELDSSHKIRGGRGGFGGRFRGMGRNTVCLDNDPAAVKQALWLATDREFKTAVNRYQRVRTNLKTMVEEEDRSADFSKEESQTCFEAEATLALDPDEWEERLRKVSAMVKEYPLIYNSGVSLSAEISNRYFVNSEGTKLQTGRKLFRVHVSASTKADDGMDLSQSYLFNASREDNLPGDDQIGAAFKGVIQQVLALREAPVVEPYTGPAILKNRASAVFFHEIFGHRIEGHRQKDVDEGQTFTKMLGKAILPEFLTVRDDPTQARFGDEDLRGYYKYDDEGVASQNVMLVDKGILKNFLMSRTPVEGFPNSNGHGRRSPGNNIVSRMGNTIIESGNMVPFDELRKLLVEECKNQGKPHGLLFDDISGGFTGTGRGSGQIFKVLPIVVYKVYADGRPDELVRGVDIVGTPLTCFSNIVYTGDDPAVFNGTCGAESGNVPVSGISPSILVSQMEVEKQARSQDKPPILPSPIGGEGE